MTSGVYKLEFPSGHYYYGKSDNIPRRLEEHKNKFIKHKHTKKMQELYNQYGLPKATVVFICHADHIDLVESMFIEDSAGNYSLNGNQPRKVSEWERDMILEYDDMLLFSTAQHLREIAELKTEIALTDAEIEELRNTGVMLPDDLDDIVQGLVDKELTPLINEATELAKELEYYRNRTFWQKFRDLF